MRCWCIGVGGIVGERRQLRTLQKAHSFVSSMSLYHGTHTSAVPCALLGGRKRDAVIAGRAPGMETVCDPGYIRGILSLHEPHQSYVFSSQLQVHLINWILLLLI